MNYYSMFLSDVDGTLVGNDFHLHDDVIQAAKDYEASGGRLILCTGRSVEALEEYSRKLNLKFPAVVYNGAGIYEFQRKRLIWKKPLGKDILHDIQFIYEHLPEICIQIFTEKGIYRMRSNWMIENHGVKEEMGKEIFSAGQAQGDILKLSFTANHRTILEKCRNLPLWKGRRYEYSSKHFTEVTSEQTGKHVAAAHLMEVLGAKKEKIFAAGNGMNDLSMLKMGHCSFAPKDAARQVLEISDILIDSPASCGMKQAFRLADQYNLQISKERRNFNEETNKADGFMRFRNCDIHTCGIHCSGIYE